MKNENSGLSSRRPSPATYLGHGFKKHCFSLWWILCVTIHLLSVPGFTTGGPIFLLLIKPCSLWAFRPPYPSLHILESSFCVLTFTSGPWLHESNLFQECSMNMTKKHRLSRNYADLTKCVALSRLPNLSELHGSPWRKSPTTRSC